MIFIKLNFFFILKIQFFYNDFLLLIKIEKLDCFVNLSFLIIWIRSDGDLGDSSE